MKKFLGILFVVLAGLSALFAQQAGNIAYNGVSWSPDGEYLSFTRMEMVNVQARKMTADIYLVKADGTGMKKVAGDEKEKFGPSWSKDGKTIYFGALLDGGKESEIYLMKRDGTGLKQLTNGFGRSSSPSVSSDGKKIVFNTESVEHKPQIAVMNADGSDPKTLTNDNTLAFYNPLWSPDGKKIVYYVERGDRKDQIWVMNADGSNQTLLTANIAHNFYPSWSADGKRIIFTSNRDGEAEVLYSMSPDGTDIKRQMTPNSFYARMSPNGKKIAFIGRKFPNTAVYVVNADGTNQVKITP